MEDTYIYLFKKQLFDHIVDSISTYFDEEINCERLGGVIDTQMLKKIMVIVNLMDVHEKEKLHYYMKYIETIYLTNSSNYYVTKSNKWMLENTTSEYLINIESSINTELERIRSYLHCSTEPKITNLILEKCITKYKMEILEKENDGLLNILKELKLDDCYRIYHLFSNIENGMVPVSDILYKYLLDLGMKIYTNRKLRLQEKNEKNESDDPQYIKDLINMYSLFYNIVSNQFNSNVLCTKSLNDAFVKIINNDTDTIKITDILCIYIDHILKSDLPEKNTDNEIEYILENCFKLFVYIRDKDYFADMYQNMLAKRLLGKKSEYKEYEAKCILYMKKSCGSQYTSRMEGMVTDFMIDNKSLIEKFNGDNLHKIKFEPQILTISYWPSYRNINVSWPNAIQQHIQAFESFYIQENPYRRLKWITSLGMAVVKSIFGKNTYTIQLSMLQASVLIILNNYKNTDISFYELREKLSIQDDILKKIMHSFCYGKYKIILRKNAIEQENDIKITDIFAINQEFTCKQRNFRIPMASLESNKNNKQVEEDRTIAIEACIVRVMKVIKINNIK